MNITDELGRLAKLHNNGALDDDEFAQAKAKLLSSHDPPKGSGHDRTMGEAASRLPTPRRLEG
jgi:hypothetical protein